MQIQLPIQHLAPTKPLTYLQIERNGTLTDFCQPILQEHALTATVNHTLSMSFVCLPDRLLELVIGHLITEHLIQSADEISQIQFNTSGTHADIILTHPLPKTLPAPCSVTPIFWKTDWIFALADRFAEGMPIHQQTTATHSCFLAIRDQILFDCEDIGRHNALDKAIGFAVLQNLPLKDCMLYSSGRVPTDMLCKALHAGVPILISKGAPTSKAAELARRYDLTLICAARRDRMKLFSGTLPKQ